MSSNRYCDGLWCFHQFRCLNFTKMKTTIMLSADMLSKCDLSKNICHNSKVQIDKLDRENEELLKMIEVNQNMVILNEQKKMAEEDGNVNKILDESKRSDSGILSDLLKSFRKSSGASSDDGEGSISGSTTLNLDYKSLIAAMSSVKIEKVDSDKVEKKIIPDHKETVVEIVSTNKPSKVEDKLKSRALIGNIITELSKAENNKKSNNKESGRFSIISIDKTKKSEKCQKELKTNSSKSDMEKKNLIEKNRSDKNNSNVEAKGKKSFKSYGDYGKHITDKHHDTFSSKVAEERLNKCANKSHDVNATVDQLTGKLSEINISDKAREHSSRRHKSKHSGDDKYSSTEGESKVDKDKDKSKEERKYSKSGEVIDKKDKSDRSKNKDKVIFLERGPVRCKTNDIRSNVPPYERQQIHRNSLSGGKVLMAISPFDYEKPLIPKTVNSSTDNLDVSFMVQPKSKGRFEKNSKKNVSRELAAIVDQLRRESAKFSSAQLGDNDECDVWNDAKELPDDFCNWEEDLNMIMEILEGDSRLKSKKANIHNSHVPVIDTNEDVQKNDPDVRFEKLHNCDPEFQSLYHLGSSILNNDKNGGLYPTEDYYKDEIYRHYSTEDSSNNTSISSPETENIMYGSQNYGSQSVPLTIQLSSPVSSECDSRKHTPDSGVSNGSLGSVSLSPFSYQTNGHSPMHGFRSPSLDRSDNFGSENHLYEYSCKPHSVSRESYSSSSPLQSPNVLFQDDDLEFVNDALSSHISGTQSDSSCATNDFVFKENPIQQDIGYNKDSPNQVSPLQNQSGINYEPNQLLFNNPQMSPVQNMLGNSDLQANELCGVLGLSEVYKSLSTNKKYSNGHTVNSKDSVNFNFPETVTNRDIVKDSHRSTGLQNDRTFKFNKRKLAPIASKDSFPCCISYKKSAKDILEEMFERLDNNLKKIICFQIHGIDDAKLMDLYDGQLSSWNENISSHLPRLPFLYATCERLLMTTATCKKFFEVYKNGHTVLDRAILTCSQSPLVARYLAECSLRALSHISTSKDISLDTSDSNGNGVLHRCTTLMGANYAVSLAGLLSLNSQGQVFNVNRVNADGYSPLHIACLRHSTPTPDSQCCCQLTVHVLLVHGQADPNTKDGKSGNTALHMAVDTGACAPGLVTLLLQHGAKPLIRNYSGGTPLDHARTASRSANRPQFPKQVMDILKKHK